MVADGPAPTDTAADAGPLRAVELRVVRMQLVEPIITACGREHDRPVLLVRARRAGAEGWGECAALPDPG